MDAQVTDSWIGRTLGGRYKILEVIGEGGMGVVYRAKQISVDREVAIKMMHTRAAQDPQWSERFQSEAKACSLLTHPNTIRLYDFGKTTLGNFYMVMELLTGQPLTSVIQHQSPMAPARVLRILMQCCASLSEAHKAGIIHRDIKPDNIMVQKLEGADDFIKLLDFSIAKRSDVAMTAAGIVMGTPQFMSPEQGRGQQIDHRSDLYSLGVVAYFMLSGRLPFHDEDPLQVLRMHQTMEIPVMDGNIPNSVAKLVSSCLDKIPARRPASAVALLEACKIWLTEIDPTLDVASDPILKNTLVGGGATANMEAPTTARPQTSSGIKTMMGASGAIGADWSRSHPPSAITTPSGPAPSLPSAPHSDAGDSGQTIVEGRTAKTSISDSQQTLIHPGGQGVAAAAAVAEAEVSDSSRTLIQEGDSRTKRTSIQSPSGPQRSDSAEMRHQADLDVRRVPTNRPTLNEFSGTPETGPPGSPAIPSGPAARMKATTISASPAAGVSPPVAIPAAPASRMNATTISASPAGVSPPVTIPDPPASRLNATTIAAAPADSPAIAISYGSDPFGELPAQSGRGSFLIACVLVAVTFGFGAYFLASTLR